MGAGLPLSSFPPGTRAREIRQDSSPPPGLPSSATTDYYFGACLGHSVEGAGDRGLLGWMAL